MSDHPDHVNSGDSGCGCGCGGHDERRAAPGTPHNPPGRTALDYRVGDYGAFLAAMLDRLASPAYPALRGLTVRTPDDPAIGLLDAWAVLGDLLTFHSERIADEGYLRTAHDPRSLALLGRLVGHVPRPGVAADTHLAYTLDRDPRAEDVVVTIPRGAISHSVPAASDEESQTYQTSEDLTARWAWNELAVRRRRPALIGPDDLRRRSELLVSGTSLGLTVGDQLLFVFGGTAESGGGGRHLLLPVARVSVDRDEDVTAIGLPQSAPPSLKELVDEVRRWITDPEADEDPDDRGDAEPTPDHPDPRPVSRLIEDFDAQVLAPLRGDLDGITTSGQLARRLAEPHDRLAEAQVLAAPYEEVAAWFERLEAVIGELRERAGELDAAGSGEVRLRSQLAEDRPRGRQRHRNRRPRRRGPRLRHRARPRHRRRARSAPSCPPCAPASYGPRPAPAPLRRTIRGGSSGRVPTWPPGCCRPSIRGCGAGCTRRGAAPPRPPPPRRVPSRCCASCWRCG
ncbi:hypothetical protein [Streptomyces rapamycinicus]|uniref:hypothetical protein n=1 Tax=Streptomyces rapamycinicus TaxID=1226757 RepID=UPI0032D94BB9